MNPQELIDAYLDGDLSADGQAELLRWLDADPEHMKIFVRATHDHKALRDAFAADEALSRAPVGPRRLAWILLGSAAAAGLALVGWSLLRARPEAHPPTVHREPVHTAPPRPPTREAREPVSPPETKKPEAPVQPSPAPELAPKPLPSPEPPPKPKPGPPAEVPKFVVAAPKPAEPTVVVAAVLKGARGDVQVQGRPSKPGQDILEGQEVHTGERLGSATLLASDGGVLELGLDTSVRIGRETIRVDKGTLSADLPKRPPGRPLRFITERAEAEILGTKLVLLVSPDSTQLQVKEGRVRFTRKEDGASIEVPAGHSALAAHGRELALKPSSARAILSRLPAGTWWSVPNTHLRDVAPDREKYGNVSGVVASWSGGALDARRNRLVVWGGASGSYLGNELYVFDMDTLSWERLTEPFPDPAPGAAANPDGTPNVRDTFGGLAYLAHVDRFFALGGTIRGANSRTAAAIAWTFDFKSKKWSSLEPSGERPVTWEGDCCAYDPTTRKLWFLDANSSGGVYSFDIDGNRWRKHNSDTLYYQDTAAIDTRRGLLVIVGHGNVSAYDIRRGNLTRQIWKTTSGDQIVAGRAVGLDYDPIADRIVGWTGGAVWALDPDTKTWTAKNAPGAPKPTEMGIYGRWRYVPSLGAFVLVTSVDENVHFFKWHP